MNRQPTLHACSMIALKVKITNVNTFRLSLGICKPFNADFDGDEINLFLESCQKQKITFGKI
jgi:DNA-directed RNA polymerase beta' subunit